MRYINHRGQIIIIISLFFAIAILMVAVLAYMTLSKTQTFSYYPYKEIVESISTDFYNALTKILATTTQIYNQTAEIDSPRRNASQLFTFWYQAAQRTYSSKGLNISTSFDKVRLQPSKNILGVSLPELYVYNLTKLYWYAPQAISAIEASLYINSAQYQFYGWKTRVLVFLNATIHLPIISDSKNKVVSFNLLVFSEKGPVNDLTKSNVVVWYFDPTVVAGVFPWKKANVTLSYLGNGNYSVTFSPDFYDNSQSAKNKRDSFWNYYYNFTLVQVEDNRGIIVEAYSYCGVEYTINEKAIEQFYPNNPNKKYETYLFELLPNGTLYWFGWKLSSISPYSPPIPIPPVKQIRVYTTTNGLGSNNFIEAPYQVELWTKDYALPTFNYAEWRKRLLEGSKIVFMVNYPPGVIVQKVKIVWLSDGDVYPPSPKINITYSPNYWDISNGIYTLRLMAIKGSYEVDYSISLIDKNGHHTEYAFFGYNILRMSSGGYWFPRKLPWDNWVVPPPGPIRMYAFRNSTAVYETINGPSGSLAHRIIYDELLHTEIISVAYNVSYFTLSFTGKWLKSTSLNYSSFIGMINGNSTDQAVLPSNRVKWGSVYSTKYNKIVNGSFASSNVQHRDRYWVKNDATYGYWLCMYNEYFGHSIFISSETYSALSSGKDQGWIWTTADYARRVMEYDSVYPFQNVVVNKGSIFYIKAAGMVYEGGSVSSQLSYYDDDTWNGTYQYKSSTGVNVPLMYYRMFTGTNNPYISSVQEISGPFWP
ncbi:MAG: hypothetical protein ACP5HX_03695 [Thermoproteota archaeon]